MIKKIGTVIIALITIFITVAAFYLVILVILMPLKLSQKTLKNIRM